MEIESYISTLEGLIKVGKSFFQGQDTPGIPERSFPYRPVNTCYHGHVPLHCLNHINMAVGTGRSINRAARAEMSTSDIQRICPATPKGWSDTNESSPFEVSVHQAAKLEIVFTGPYGNLRE